MKKNSVKKALLLSLSALLINSCGSELIGQESFEQTGISSWGSKKTATQLSNGTMLTTNNQVRLLVDQDEIFPEIYNLIDQAKEKIYVTTYLFGGNVGHKIAEKLIAKKQQGVDVRFITEPTMGTLGPLVDSARKEYKFLIQNGVDVRNFPVNSLPKGPTFLSNQKVINHAKMVIVDDSSVIIGGMNFKDTEAINHDFMLKISGPAAKELAVIGDANWEKAAQMKVKAFDEVQADTPVLEEPVPTAPGATNVEIAQTGFTVQSIDDMLITNINNAKSSIIIEMLLMDHQEVVKAIVEAKGRGVDVRVILDEVQFGKYSKILDKLPLDGMANFGAVLSLMDAGIPVNWYVTNVKDRMLHAKAAMIDDQVFITGSANFTYHALTRNHEVSVAVSDPGVTSRFRQVFEQDWRNNSKPAKLTSSQKILGKLVKKFGNFVYQNKTESQIKAEIKAAQPETRALFSK